MVDVFAFIALCAEDVGGLFGDADADGKGAPRGGATLCKLVITHWCKNIVIRKWVVVNSLYFHGLPVHQLVERVRLYFLSVNLESLHFLD